MTATGSETTERRPRVLIVEPDGMLALATMRACLDAGLEPKLCMGADKDPSRCAGLNGEPCPRTATVEATLITIDTGYSRMAAPACMGGRVILAGERPMLGDSTKAALDPDATLSYPYDPETAAAMLLQLVRDARKEKLWDHIRHGRAPTRG